MWLGGHVCLAGVDCTSVIAALWSCRQGEHKFKLILGYIVGFI